jgi:hypothetical protein
MNGLCGLIIIGPALWRAGWLFLTFLALLSVFSYYITKATWKGKSPLDLDMEEQVAQGAGSSGNMSSRFLVVRPVWARIAVGMDLIVLFIMSHGSWSAWRDTSDYSVPVGLVAVLTFLAVAGTFVWFWEYSHRKATEPATPLRLPVLAKTPQEQM